MRSTSLVLAALTGLAVSTFAAPAGAFTPTSSAAVGPAAQSVDPVASVHCRSYKHRSYNHGWSFGCGGGGGVHVNIHEREGGRVHRRGFEEREGVRTRVNERSSTRSETNVRSRERGNVRGEVKSGTSGNSSTGKSGSTGKTETHGGTSGGGNTGTGGGGTSGQSSGGQR